MRIVDGMDKYVSDRTGHYVRFCIADGDDLFYVSVSIKKIKALVKRAALSKWRKSVGGPITVRRALNRKGRR